MNTSTRKFLLTAVMAGFLVHSGAYASVIVLSQLSNTDTANPGQTYTGIIKIKNDGLVEELVSLSQNDYLFFADGSNIYGEPGVDPRSNASWIKLAETEVRIAPGMEYEVAYMVAVPGRTNLTGSFWSLVMVQSITQSSLNPDNQAEDSVSVSAGMRYGIQIITNIGDTGKRNLRFYDTKLDKGELFSTLRISLENTGERRLVADPYADIYSATGKALGRIQLSAWGLYPGTSIRVEFPLKDMAPGRYKIQVVADCGGNDLFGAVYSLELK